MNVHLPECALPRAIRENGMDRFFNPTNLALYSKLADGEIAAIERSLVLKALAKEWDAFMRECRIPSVERVGPLEEHIAFRSQD